MAKVVSQQITEVQQEVMTLVDIVSGNNLCEEEETNNGRAEENLG